MQSKLTALLTSRKFWALVTALVGDAAAYATHQIDANAAIMALVAAVSAYILGTSVEDHGVAVAAGNVAAASVTPPVVEVTPGLPPRG